MVAINRQLSIPCPILGNGSQVGFAPFHSKSGLPLPPPNHNA